MFVCKLSGCGFESRCSHLNWNDVFNSKAADEKVKNLNNILLDISRNFIPPKIFKFHYKYPNWMNTKIILLLRKRSKLTKKYYSYSTEETKKRYTRIK